MGTIDVGAPELQSQFQVHVQLQLHACCWVSVHRLPSAVVHVHVHVNFPVVGVVVAGLPVAGALDDVGSHDQFQLEPTVGAALVAVAPVIGVPLPVQVQFHDHWSPGAPMALPGRTIETLRLFPPLTLTTLRSGLVA